MNVNDWGGGLFEFYLLSIHILDHGFNKINEVFKSV